jgi:hypothetical protein
VPECKSQPQQPHSRRCPHTHFKHVQCMCFQGWHSTSSHTTHLLGSSSSRRPAALLALRALMAPRITALLSAPGPGVPRLARLHLSAWLPRRLITKLGPGPPPLGPAEPEPRTGGEVKPSARPAGLACCCCCLLPERSSWRTTGSSALLATLLGVAEQLVSLLLLLQREKPSVSLERGWGGGAAGVSARPRCGAEGKHFFSFYFLSSSFFIFYKRACMRCTAGQGSTRACAGQCRRPVVPAAQQPAASHSHGVCAQAWHLYAQVHAQVYAQVYA